MKRARLLAFAVAATALVLSAAPSCDEATPFDAPCKSAADCTLPYVCCHETVLADIDPSALDHCIEPFACPKPDPFLIAGNPCHRGGPPRYETDDPKVLGECAPPLVCCPGTLTCAPNGGCPPPKPPITASHAECTADEDCEAAAVCCGIHAFARHGTCTSVEECGGSSSGGTGGAAGASGAGGAAGAAGAAGASAGGSGGGISVGSGACDPPGPGGPPAPASACDVAAVPGLAAYLRFDETSGPACDASGSGHDGVVDASVKRGVPGKFGLGAQMGGNGVRIATSPSLDQTGGRTIEAWIQIASAVGVSSVVGRGTGNNDANVFLWTSGGATVVATWSDGQSTASLSSKSAVSTGVWNHIALVDDGATARLYVNAQIAAEGKGGPLASLSSDIVIGARDATTFNFLGVLDEIKWWTVVRTQPQICVDAGGTWSTAQCSCVLPP